MPTYIKFINNYLQPNSKLCKHNIILCKLKKEFDNFNINSAYNERLSMH